MGLRLQNPVTEEWVNDASFMVIQEDTRSKEAAETKRLLYVAMTRAKKRLILSGALSSSDKNTTWMKMVASVVQPEPVIGTEFFAEKEMPKNSAARISFPNFKELK